MYLHKRTALSRQSSFKLNVMCTSCLHSKQNLTQYRPYVQHFQAKVFFVLKDKELQSIYLCDHMP